MKYNFLRDIPKEIFTEKRKIRPCLSGKSTWCRKAFAGFKSERICDYCTVINRTIGNMSETQPKPKRGTRT